MVCPGCVIILSLGKVEFGWGGRMIECMLMLLLFMLSSFIVLSVLLIIVLRSLCLFFYGLHNIHDRKDLWRGIGAIGSVSMPWLCTGDFNSVLLPEDRVHGNVVTDYEVRDFKDFIDQMNFSEIKSKGSYFLWSNKAHSGPRTQTRIDRGLVNSEWLFQFPNVEAVYLPPSLSDHAPLLYEVLPPAPCKGKPFRFLNHMLTHPDFMNIVDEIWSEGFQGNAMNRIWRKCKNLKVKLKELNTKAYGNVEMRVDLAQQAVLEVQNQMANDPHSDLLVQEATAIQQLKYWRFVQESIYRQKARVEWVKLEIVSFYKLLLGSSSSVLDAIDLNTMRAGKQLSAEAQNLLISPVVNSEIDCAIKSISDDKAPGTLHPQWNCTTLTLVPKIQNPSFIISKILTARLAQVVGDIVDEAQAGFIPGKHIGDNILLATELIKGYTHKHITPRCMIKVDLKKAYDSIEWSFLKAVMFELGFSSVFVNWIMVCISTVSFSILINGSPSVPFKAQKGLRQGDPMSPFLFAIGMEYLSRFLHDLATVPDFNFHPRCERLLITHLMFADDLLLFTRADECSVQLLFKAFQKFSKASGLEANLLKSEVYFGGVGIDLQAALLSRLGWASKFLSYAGRLQLIKSVLFGIQTYWAQIFILPKKIMKEIESRFKAFLWTGNANPSKKALIAWSTVCLPKSCGGWNIISLHDWNISAICKILWDIAHKTDSLWVKWVHIYYFRSVSFWEADIPKKSSWVLRKIMKYRGLIDDIGGWDPVMSNNRVQIMLIYKKLKIQAPKVPCKRLTCNNGASPRSIFILWLALWNRLLTKDRVLKWNPTYDPVCLLCLQENETPRHLFFLCNYSKRIWEKVLQLLKCHKSVQGFDQEMDWAMKRGRRSNSNARLHLMFLAETVYSIWIQRNNTMFNGNREPAETVFRAVVYRVSCRCNEADRQALISVPT
ncbi:uncharacterized protein LOC110734397 [Chenopodium quinoa]|uniref:uncharacterized protein LOC110734397 n=1 Tax=Chenopodium quinoa TaxID=63459 RepID=UPI000B78D936|nr:uncharacterized protein LOC110734397 [Chenopodium quinoa]